MVVTVLRVTSAVMNLTTVTNFHGLSQSRLGKVLKQATTATTNLVAIS
jgi:hypothetical protein